MVDMYTVNGFRLERVKFETKPVVNCSTVPLSKFVTLMMYPVMSPFLSSGRGRFQFSKMLVGLKAVAVMLVGGPLGAEIERGLLI